MKTATDPYVEFLLDEWRMRGCSSRIQICVRRVLKELSGDALLYLRREPRFGSDGATGGGLQRLGLLPASQKATHRPKTEAETHYASVASAERKAFSGTAFETFGG